MMSETSVCFTLTAQINTLFAVERGSSHIDNSHDFLVQLMVFHTSPQAQIPALVIAWEHQLPPSHIQTRMKELPEAREALVVLHPR